MGKERLATADLADDDAIGSHAERVAHEVAHRNLALALDGRRSRLEADDMGLREPQLGGVFIVISRSPSS